MMVALTGRAFAQDEPSNYKVAIAQFKTFYNSDAPDSVFNHFSPEMKTALPAEKFRATTVQLKTQLGALVKTEFLRYNSPLAVYKATFEHGLFSLNISLNSKNQFIGLLFTPYDPSGNKVDPSLIESPILSKTFTGTIAGTLTMPKNASGKIPVVLIIPGSGAVDRNGNGPGLATNVYKLMAESLGKNGIASVRYDKRMIGESAGTAKEENLRFDDYVDDAIALISLLKDDARFSKVIVLGHSEGSLVGILASNASDGNVGGLISVAGAGVRADEIITEQMKAYPKYLADEFGVILDSLRRGKIQKSVDPSLYFIIRPSIQMYIMTWCRFEPAKEIKKIKVPTLIIQGTTDLQVKVDNAEKLKKGKSSATLTIIPGMNHILKEAPPDKEKNLATYNDPSLPLKPEFVTSVVDFINGLK